MKAIRKKMEKADLKKAEKVVANADAAAQREQIERALLSLKAATKKGVVEAVRKSRIQNGRDASPDGPMLAAALAELARFLVANGVLVPGRNTDALANWGIAAIVEGAVAGKAASEEKRIITL